MKKFILIIVLATLCLFFRADAQSQVNNIKPLNIGDTIPEAVWNLPLQVVNHPEGKKTITLNDYKGKLIILDFWATNCSSCIKAIPKLDWVQQKFKDSLIILPVTYEEREKALIAFKKNTILNRSNLSVVVDDSSLKALFPHQYISHLVWIDLQGIIRAFTHADYVSQDNINLLFKNNKVNWPVKRDIVEFDYMQDIFVPNMYNIPSHSQPAIKYHSAVTSHMENVDYRYLVHRDTLSNVIRIHAINLPIKDIYFRLMGLDDFPISHIITETDNRQRFIFNPKTEYKDAWDIKNTFCYEGVFPLKTTELQIEKRIKADLDFYFGLYTSMEEKKVKCLIISGDRKNSKPLKGNPIYDVELTKAIYLLNRIMPSCPVIDETTDQRTDVLLRINEERISDLQSLLTALHEQGFYLTEQEKTIRMFVIKDVKELN